MHPSVLLWGVWAVMAKKDLEQARNFERKQERRLLLIVLRNSGSLDNIKIGPVL